MKKVTKKPVAKKAVAKKPMMKSGGTKKPLKKAQYGQTYQGPLTEEDQARYDTGFGPVPYLTGAFGRGINSNPTSAEFFRNSSIASTSPGGVPKRNFTKKEKKQFGMEKDGGTKKTKGLVKSKPVSKIRTAKKGGSTKRRK